MKPILWITATIFILFIFMGLGNYIFSRRETTIAAQINKKKIKAKEFYKTLYNQIQTYRYVYQMDITDEMMPQIKKSTLDGMIQSELVSQQIKKQGIKISNQELIEQIRQDPAFQKDGKFNQKLYLEKLSYQRISPQIYENGIRNSLKNKKMRELITASAKVTTEEIWEEYKARKYDPQKETDTFEKRKDSIKDYLLYMKQNLYFQEWLNHIKAKSNIINNLAQIDPTVK